MPELPEVKVVVLALNKYIINKKIKNLIIYKSKLFKELEPNEFIDKLKNKTIKEITNRGKHIIIKLSDNIVLLSHLRMEGKYRFFDKPSANNPHIIAKFVFDDNSELQYLDSRMFGTFHLRNWNNYDKILPISKIANEPSKINVELLFNELKKSSSPIKTKLLDQELVSGIGNIYVDEALFKAKIHPSTPAKSISIDELTNIINFVNTIMEDSFKKGGTTLFSYESLNRQIGAYQNFLQIHSDNITSCKVCGNKTRKIKVNNRGTYFCPFCQKLK
ncbi:DNA-formamidopyrimidine glycosylase [Metamycoplasma buccale]|uniref:DNA-formamidopyrimidine glycosylase n=1 Tax=Metamycoplasma buccale TaxID=55602 RepID=UPI00398EB343